MAKLTVYGRLGKCEERGENKEYLSFGVAEPSYKKEGSNEYITPWFNFLIKADSPTAKFLKANAEKISVLVVSANERQVSKDGKTEYYHNVTNVEVISWKKAEESAGSEPVSSAAEEETVPDYPWNH